MSDKNPPEEKRDDCKQQQCCEKTCKCECKCKDEPSNFDLYKIALATRNFEIDLSWKRSNYFLVLNTAIAVGFFWLDSQSNEDVHKLFIIVSGIIISILWVNVNFGSKYWQSYWEQRLLKVEEELNITNKRIRVNFFTTKRKIINKAVSDNLGAIDEEENELDSEFKHKRFDKHIIYKYGVLEKKPSVSYAMTWLSIFFCFFWNLLLAYTAYCMFGFLSAVMVFFAGCLFIVACLFCKLYSGAFWGSIITSAVLIACVIINYCYLQFVYHCC